MSRTGEWFCAMRRLVAIWRLARVQAEALVWRHGAAGVEAARERLRAAAGAPTPDWTLAWLACRIAEDRQRRLASADTATRYAILAEWRSRRGALLGDCQPSSR